MKRKLRLTFPIQISLLIIFFFNGFVSIYAQIFNKARIIILKGLILFVLALFVQRVDGQNRVILNTSFETGFLQNFSQYKILASQGSSTPEVDGWYSNHPVFNGIQTPIEVWRSGFNGVNAQDGNYFVELNVLQPTRLYQIIYLVNGETIQWSLHHRKTPSLSATQQVEVNLYDQTGTSKLYVIGSHTATSSSSWDAASGSYVFTGPTGIYQLGFESAQPSSGDIGNLLDNISIEIKPLVEFIESSNRIVESNGSYRPNFQVNGKVNNVSSITFSVVGGNAVEGVDYTFPNKTITINPGIYSKSNAIPIGLTLINNSADTGERTLTLRISSVTGELANLDSDGNGYKGDLTITIVDDDLGFSLPNLWFKANQGVTPGATFTWANQGILAFDATQASASSQPTLVTSGANQINFNPSLSFDGTSDWLETATISDVIGTSGGSEQSTQFAVYRRTNTSQDNNNPVYQFGNADVQGETRIMLGNANGMYHQRMQRYKGTLSAGEVALIDMTAVSSASSQTLSYQKNGDGSAVSSFGSYGNEQINRSFKIGGRTNKDFAAVDIAEILVFPTTLSSADRNKIQSYLALKYGISLGDNTSAVAYTSSNGTTLWPANATYKYDIFGIGKDDGSRLNQT
ncbi:hypothetical protein [Siansivirga zeaxanthinifaciens]|uniref:DUF8202 domain-containing protein n=1 Tax=Siansivirga zeaxanthinifaciens CC-SAMT-1 TaxID=1454006 RepID=A0A0C5WHU0_9FLAO|nr:hypothetical protein [Siansivirga zeaxanthinifaciens]AJR04724.1 hypothetical protein AW14_02055 [Siansivirga zeaxanthinifaciens CC-SAMT-1]